MLECVTLCFSAYKNSSSKYLLKLPQDEQISQRCIVLGKSVLKLILTIGVSGIETLEVRVIPSHLL